MRAALSCHLLSRWYYALGYLYSESRVQKERKSKKLFTKIFLIPPGAYRAEKDVEHWQLFII